MAYLDCLQKTPHTTTQNTAVNCSISITVAVVRRVAAQRMGKPRGHMSRNWECLPHNVTERDIEDRSWHLHDNVLSPTRGTLNESGCTLLHPSCHLL